MSMDVMPREEIWCLWTSLKTGLSLPITGKDLMTLNNCFFNQKGGKFEKRIY